MEGGYHRQGLRPLSAHPPVYQINNGYGIGIGLHLNTGDSYHEGEVNYVSQTDNRLQPSGIPAPTNKYTLLSLSYQYTMFHFQSLWDLPLHFGTGPYLFVNDQTSFYPAVEGPMIASGSIQYGGGINLVLQYKPPNLPLTARLLFVNGGFLGRSEANRQSELNYSSSLNGWFSHIEMETRYRIDKNWRFYLSYTLSERIEYRSPFSQRRTFHNLGLGISYRLEDD